MYLCIRTPTPSRAVRLVFRGLEISEYDYQYVDQATEDQFVSKIGQRTAKKDIVKAEIKLIEYPGGFSIGNYSYPFQYQLPHNLPGRWPLCVYRHPLSLWKGWFVFLMEGVACIVQGCSTQDMRTGKVGVSGRAS